MELFRYSQTFLHNNKAIKLLALILIICINPSCINNNVNMDNLKQEVLNTEMEFEKMAKDKGIAEAFKYFADDSAVIMRNNQLVKGKKDIFNYYLSNDLYSSAQLNWRPDFIDVSESGDMAYTYGKYVFKYIGSNNKLVTNEGIFHTVWKKQNSGEWKFVWD